MVSAFASTKYNLLAFAMITANLARKKFEFKCLTNAGIVLV
jgi:hypothetical protein